MTTTTHYTALLADDRRRRLVADATAHRLTRTERRPRRRHAQPVPAPAHTLQTRCA